MKIFWLTPMQFAYAFGIGVLLAGAFIFAAAPHPVSVPVKVITPVPTPPPVVITQQPAPAPVNSLDLNQEAIVIMMVDTMMSTMFPLVTIAVIITFISMLLRMRS